MDFIEEILSQIRDLDCPCCSVKLRSCTVLSITAESESMVVKLKCSACLENSLAVVQEKTLKSAEASPRQIEVGEVKEAHDLLTKGPIRVADLFAPNP